MHHGKNFRGNPVLGSVQNLNRHSFVSGAIGVIALAGLSSSVSAQVSYDLTSGLTAVQVNGAFFFPETSASASGSGVYDSFYALGNSPAVEGYNTGLASRMPDVANSPNDAIRLADLRVPANNPVLGVNYYSFGLDVNEPNNDLRFLSVDNVEVYISATQLNPANTYAALQTGAELIYSLDALENSEILLDYTSSGSGSGRADMIFLIPQTLFPPTKDGEANYFIYLYSTLGGKGGVWAQDQGGFEEWNTVAGLSFTIVPEAHTWAAGISLAGLAGAAWMRRRLPGKPVA